MTVVRTADQLDKISEGLHFLLSHLQYGLEFPRTISTHRFHGAQIPVDSFKDSMVEFESSVGLDCRVNAYPQYTDDYKKRDAYKATVTGGNGILADLLFIDLDNGAFHNESSLKAVLFATLDRIDKKLHGRFKPTVLWTGNGYHLYLPVQMSGPSWCLAHTDVFHELGGKEVDRKFLQWAEKYLSDGQADPNHSRGLSFNNCLLRVPGSINSKEDCEPGKEEVTVLQGWDGKRPYINWILRDFRDHLIEDKSKSSGRGRGGSGNGGNMTLSNTFSTVWRKN